MVVISTDSSNDKFELDTANKSLANKHKDETYLNESKILMMLNQTENENNVDREKENEDALEDVWNNFDGNQFDDYGDYNNNDFEQDSIQQHESVEKNDHDNSAKDDRDEVDNELIDIVLERPSTTIPTNSIITAKKTTEPDLDNDSSIDYDELELVLNHVEETHALSQKQKSFSNNEKTPVCLKNDEKIKNKNLSKVQNQQLNVSALTPMPSYSTMDTPNLRDNLKQFGIKV